ncbi:hypothetical protein CCM_06339 [Cordyceps militaris CM01]|uniref:Uncharacterized protein n=1 Tax=Cordyceps militaris (strain CM01) TaxID=983644 RepID=G3JK48_CORMM|nr:uncharacterized protein CCM_06339 [Cordyceps militaris CM01]EGX92178.1 hypothetical protein CCM_06339 [Cordyceps militaris CM01]
MPVEELFLLPLAPMQGYRLGHPVDPPKAKIRIRKPACACIAGFRDRPCMDARGPDAENPLWQLAHRKLRVRAAEAKAFADGPSRRAAGAGHHHTAHRRGHVQAGADLDARFGPEPGLDGAVLGKRQQSEAHVAFASLARVGTGRDAPARHDKVAAGPHHARRANVGAQTPGLAGLRVGEGEDALVRFDGLHARLHEPGEPPGGIAACGKRHLEAVVVLGFAVEVGDVAVPGVEDVGGCEAKVVDRHDDG